MNCPICNNNNNKIHFIKDELIILKCDACSFYFVDLENWKHPYSNTDYYSSDDLITDPSQLEFIKHRVDQILKYITTGDGVDLGCGKGEVTVQLANKGFNMTGIDDSLNTINNLIEIHKSVNWECNSIEMFLDKCKKVDLITMYHVLEHIPNPKILINKISNILNKDGIFVVEVPDVGSYKATFEGKNWQYWMPHHVNYFSVDSLKKLIEPLNLELVGVERKYHFCYPLKGKWYNTIHKLFSLIGYNDIIVTYWKKK